MLGFWLISHPCPSGPPAAAERKRRRSRPGVSSRASSPALGRACSRPGALAISAKTAWCAAASVGAH